MRTLGLAFVTACACTLAFASPAVAANENVRITMTGFAPVAVTIDRGDTVTWRNLTPTEAQVAADNGAFRSPVLEAGAAYSFQFTRSGTYTYSDTKSTTPRKGTVVVRPLGSPSVTIAASRSVVTFGGSVVLSGTISSGEPGEAVRVTGTPYRGGGFSRTVETDAEGVWRLAVRPQIRTIYRAFWRGQESSTEPAVHVRSRVGISLRNASAVRMYVRVFAAYSYRGKLVRLQRQTPDGRWVTVRFVRLGPLAAATFRARLPRGATRTRVAVPASPGYLTGISRVVIVRR
jgi:plastocyanin